MSQLRRLVSRLVNLVRPGRAEAELAREITAHLNLLEDEYRCRGYSESEARTAARRTLGGVESTKELQRAARSFRWLNDFRQDVRIAIRSLKHAPGFAVTAISSLSLGVALTASTLSLINAYVVRAMPFPNSERLYRVIYDSPGQPEPRGLDRVDWKALEGVIDIADDSELARFILHTDNYPQEISSLRCAPGAIEAIGLRAALGRTFSADDFRPGAERVIMISDALWHERFGASPTVLESTIRVSAANSGDIPATYRVIGVLPPGFRYVGNDRLDPVDTAIPLAVPHAVYMVRLREGVASAVAAQRISEAVRSAAVEVPSGWRCVRLESVHAHYVRDVHQVLTGVTVAAAIVLLIVVTNVSVLVLLRGVRRQGETAVRIALGAGPQRMVRLFFAEAALICGIALVVGLAITAATLRTLGPRIEAQLSLPVPGGVSTLAIDSTVLIWIGGIGLLIVLLLAWLPMMAARPTRLIGTLRAASRNGTDRTTVRRARTVLVTLEVAASAALLIGGGLMVRSLTHLMTTDLGYDTDRVLRVRIQLPNSRYRDEVEFGRFYGDLEQQLEAIPDLSFALSTSVPFWEPTKHPVETAEQTHSVLSTSLSATGPEYFRLLSIKVLEGRTFTLADRVGSEPVIVVSASLAHALSPDRSLLGTRIRTRESSGTGESVMVSRTVVGVVGDVHQTPDDVDLLDVYIPFAQGTSRFASVYFRTNGSSQQWLETIRTVVASIDNEVFVGSAPILSDQVDGLLAGPRFITAVLSVFAAFSALLALMGIYGVTAYVVQQRAREIAIRMAIGASAATVTLMFFRNSSKILMIGIFCGLTAGAAGARILQSQLHGVDRLDPWTFIATGLFLATTGLLATWLPAWRLVHDDPTRALRAE